MIKNCLLALIFMAFIVPLQAEDFTVMFYNVENLFDCEDDSLKHDEEYLEGGMRGWNVAKYRRKLNNISMVVSAASGWEPPLIVGMCEVENDRALMDLVKTTGLRKFGYRFLHFESPDARGVDVALLYRSDFVKLLESDTLRIQFPGEIKSSTRDVLYAKFCVYNTDTLHVMVCHLPSRLGGEAETNEKRKAVALRIRKKVDEVFAVNPNANLLVMGDMNDYPSNESLEQVLRAKSPILILNDGRLYNLMYDIRGQGTHKYESEWGVLDHVIISKGLLEGKGKFKADAAEIVKLPFLLEEDEKFFDKKPFRTYNGIKYQGGYSDHLPVKLNIKIKE